jgi:hypothetical protein
MSEILTTQSEAYSNFQRTRTLEHPLGLGVQIKSAVILLTSTEVALLFVNDRGIRHGEMKEGGVCFAVKTKIYVPYFHGMRTRDREHYRPARKKDRATFRAWDAKRSEARRSSSRKYV